MKKYHLPTDAHKMDNARQKKKKESLEWLIFVSTFSHVRRVLLISFSGDIY